MSTLPVPSFPDPNVGRNRVPTEGEYRTFKTLAESNSRIALVLDEEIKTLRESYLFIHARYLEQQLELQATQSQLYMAKDLLEAVQKQRVSLQVEQDKLSVLAHPIRRVPDEMLQGIFERIADESPDYWPPKSDELSRLQQALVLASVCRRWRAVSIDTPHLWSRVYLNFSNKPGSIKFFGDNILPRVNGLQCAISIRSIKTKTATILFDASNIGSLTSIRRLSLHFSTLYDLEHGMNTLVIPPTCKPQDLHVSCKKDDQPTSHRVNILSLISSIPLVPRVSIALSFGLEFHSMYRNPNITSLQIHNSPGIRLMDLMAALPGLEVLNIIESTIGVANTLPLCKSSSLRSLLLLTTGEEDWMAQTNLSRLENLWYFNKKIGDSFIAFVSAHRSLKRIDCLNKDGDDDFIVALSNAAPQLTELVICPPFDTLTWSMGSDSTIPFPSLQSLTINIGCSPSFHTIEHFESLIRRRFLPLRHPKCLAIHPSNIIPRIAFTRPYSTPEWYESDLYKESVRSVPYSNDYRNDLTQISWPKWS